MNPKEFNPQENPEDATREQTTIRIAHEMVVELEDIVRQSDNVTVEGGVPIQDDIEILKEIREELESCLRMNLLNRFDDISVNEVNSRNFDTLKNTMFEAYTSLYDLLAMIAFAFDDIDLYPDEIEEIEKALIFAEENNADDLKFPFFDTADYLEEVSKLRRRINESKM